MSVETRTTTGNGAPQAADLRKVRDDMREILGDTARATVNRAQEFGGKAMERASEATSKMSTNAKIAVGVGAAVVGLAALRLAANRLGKVRGKGAKVTYHLEPAEPDGWRLRLEGADRAEVRYDTKREGLQAARELVGERAPSELVIHLSDGSEQERHRYEDEASG